MLGPSFFFGYCHGVGGQGGYSSGTIAHKKQKG